MELRGQVVVSMLCSRGIGRELRMRPTTAEAHHRARVFGHLLRANGMKGRRLIGGPGRAVSLLTAVCMLASLVAAGAEPSAACRALAKQFAETPEHLSPDHLIRLQACVHRELGNRGIDQSGALPPPTTNMAATSFTSVRTDADRPGSLLYQLARPDPREPLPDIGGASRRLIPSAPPQTAIIAGLGRDAAPDASKTWRDRPPGTLEASTGGACPAATQSAWGSTSRRGCR